MVIDPPASTPGPSRRRSALLRKQRQDEIAAALGDEGDTKLRVLLESLRPADLGEMLEHLGEGESTRVLDSMERRRAARVLVRARAPVAAAAVERMDHGRAAELLDWMAVDDRASILELLPPEAQEGILAEMEQRLAGEVRASLAWPPQSVGRLLQSNVVIVPPDLTLREALEDVRAQAPAERTGDVYVVDGEHHLVGIIPLAELVFGTADATVASVMSRDLITASPTDDQESAARQFSKYDLLALPVVGARGAFLGVVTIDDIMDVLEEEHGEDVLNMGAVETSTIATESYFNLGIGQLVRSRVGWLILLFAAESLTGTVLRHFEHELARVVALSFFIPLLIGTGGNAGSQTVSTVIRGLALGEVRTQDWARLLAREAAVGAVLGVILGSIAFGRAWLWGQPMAICTAVGVSILAICLWSNSVGAMIPILAQRLKVDPTVASAPLITTLVDGTGLYIYLRVASAILKL